jgi:hypothetical protein
VTLGFYVRKSHDQVIPINNIVWHTDLLAPNATIKVRAWDAGREFAVVANEVRELSISQDPERSAYADRSRCCAESRY